MTSGTALDLVLEKLEGVKLSGSGYTARCPGHEDRQNSLSVRASDEGHVLLKCHAGCENAHVVAALGLEMRDLFVPGPSVVRQNGQGKRIVATYAYCDEAGTLLYQVVRFDPKDFRPRRPDGRGGWRWGMGEGQRVLYRLPDLLAADSADWVLYPEGEKDADNLTALGFTTTTNVGGAGKWRPEYGEPLRGRRVVLLPDNDEPGRQGAERIAQALHGIAGEVRVLCLPGLPPKGDVSDAIAAGITAAELAQMIEDAPAWEPAVEPDAREAPAFPLDALPPAVRAYVAAAADSLSVPPEMVAVPFLGITGALIGNRLSILLKASWREYPCLYLAIVAPPGAAKTPALGLARWPLDALQKTAHERYAERLEDYEDKLDAWRSEGQKRGEEKPTKPELRHYFSTDLTVEALASMLGNVPGLAIIRDEISGWVAGMDQYKGGKGSDRQQYLSLWSGQPLKVDRKGGGSVFVAAPVACVVGGIQPDLAGTLHDAAKGRDGFVERLLTVVPKVGPARWTDAAPGPDHYRGVQEMFTALDTLPSRESDADPTRTSTGEIVLDPEARVLWISWVNENATLTADAEGLAAGFYSKLPAHVARLALILHALWHPNSPPRMVAAEQMRDAIELGEFFRAHIGKFLALLEAAVPAGTAGLDSRILRILRNAHEPAGWVGRSDIYRGLRNVTAEDLTATLEHLIDAGTIERRSVPSATKPQEQYRIRISQNSHNPGTPDASMVPDPPIGAEDANYENCESPLRAERRGSTPMAAPGQQVVRL